MKQKFATTKTVLISLLLVLSICCLAISVALTYSEQRAQAEGVIAVDELPSDGSASDYDIMPIATTYPVKDVDTWQTAVSSVGNGDTIRLTDDVTLTKSIPLNIATAISVTLDLNGHTLTGWYNNTLIFVTNAGATLTLTDTSSDKSGVLTGAYRGVNVSAGTLNMIAGTITGMVINNTSIGAGVWASGSSSVFNMSGGKITNNYSGSSGGGVALSDGATFTMSGNAEISDNVARNNGSGGGVTMNTNSKFTMNGGTISGNSADYYGGGVYITRGSTFTIKNGTISGNASGNYGAGVCVLGQSGYDAPSFTMDGGTISGNSTPVYGGGVIVYGTGQAATFQMNNGTISGNVVTGSGSRGGGGLQVMGDLASCTMKGGEIVGNVSYSEGGGVRVNGGASFTMTGGKINRNVATKIGDGYYGNGGGIAVGAGNTVTITNGEISENSAAYGGGGVYFVGANSTHNITSTTITNNTANDGGGIYIFGESSLTMKQVTISGNEASKGGGIGVYSGPTVVASDIVITQNTASTGDGGGVIVSLNSSFTVTGNSEISNNTSFSAGGGVRIVNANSIFDMTGGKISGNRVFMRNGTEGAGGGILAGASTTLKLTDVEISDNMSENIGAGIILTGGIESVTFSGSIKISNNYMLNGTASNLELRGATFTLGTLKSGADIGISYAAYRGNSPFAFVSGVAESIKQYFQSDDSTRCIGYSDGSLVLGNHVLIWDTTDESTHVQNCANCGASENSGNHNYEYATDEGGTTHSQVCSDCGKRVNAVAHNVTLFISANGSTHTGYCDDCHAQVTEDHSWDNGSLKSNLDGHWYACSVCGEKQDGGTTHNWNDMEWTAENGNHFKKCSECQQTNYVDKHILEKTEEVKATCQDYGYKEYYYCSTCKKYFTDDKGEKLIEDFEQWQGRTGDNGGKLGIDNSAHNWSEEYTSNVSGHWHACLNAGCLERKENPILTHNYNGTYYDDGEGKHYQICVDCKYSTTPEEHTVLNWVSQGSETHQGQCETCKLTLTASHDWETETKTFNDNGHWYACKATNCTAQKDYSEHKVTDWSNLDSDMHQGDCDECNKTNITASHDWNSWTDDKQGNHERTCSTCQTKESKAHKLTHITYVDSTNHGGYCDECKLYVEEEHTATGDIKSSTNHDENSHWQTCSECNTKLNETIHNWEEGIWQVEEDYHYKTCEECTQQYKQSHSVTEWTKVEESNNHQGTCVCGKQFTNEHTLVWQTDESGKYFQKCSFCDYETAHKELDDKHEHVYNIPKSDEAGHWNECICGAYDEIQPHTLDAWTVEAGNHYQECSECFYKVRNEKHVLTKHTGYEATCNSTGLKDYWECLVCNSYFLDEKGTQQITDEISDWLQDEGKGVIPKTEIHSYDEENWKSSELGHWYECTVCGQKKSEPISHVEGQWTDNGDGRHFKACTDCNYVTQTESHNGTNWKTDGNQTHTGTCQECSAAVTEKHSAGVNFAHDSNNHWNTCDKDCGEHFNETAHVGHDWKNVGDESFHQGTCDCGYDEVKQEHSVTEWTKVEESNNHQGSCVCGKQFTNEHTLVWTVDEEGLYFQQCTFCDYETAHEELGKVHNHEFKTRQHDESYHWDECECGARTNVQAHSVNEWNMKDAITHTGRCTECNAEVVQGHELNKDGECEHCEYVMTNLPDCNHVVTSGTANGDETHSGVCTICGKTVSVAHVWTSNHDNAKHWQECEICGVHNNESEHVISWTTDGEHTHTGICSECEETITDDHHWLFGFCTECRDELGKYAQEDVGIAAVAIVGQLLAIIAVAAIISRRMKR